VNIRRLRGAETALIHPQTADVWVVREGSGTLVTGGTLVDAKGQPVQGQSAAAIRGGVERVIKAGDVVFIPAGVPHGIKDSKAITWLNIRFDTK
jgi:mannose-6-phosphate isomerase-like protein (cupin superfamily)